MAPVAEHRADPLPGSQPNMIPELKSGRESRAVPHCLVSSLLPAALHQKLNTKDVLWFWFLSLDLSSHLYSLRGYGAKLPSA